MRRVLLVMGVLALIGPSWASATEEKTLVMEDVVVTATKTEEQRKDIPNAVILMNRLDIEESSATSLGELLANELGIDWRTYGDFGGASSSIQIRGMSANGTQVLVNGISMNSPSLGVADTSRIPLNSIDRIEVVKGSGSLLYGSGAMGGIINILTKRPERNKVDLKASAGYGTEDTYQVSAEHGQFIFGDFGYYLTANRKETDGFRGNSDLTHNDASLNLVFDKGKGLNISLYGNLTDREYGMPGVKPPAGTQAYWNSGQKLYDSESSDLLNRGEDDDKHLSLRIKGNPFEWMGFSLQGNYSNLENYTYSRYFSAGLAPAPDTIPGSKTWVINEVYSTEGNVEISPISDLRLLIGGDYKNYEWDNDTVNLDTNGTEVAGTRASSNAKLHTKGAFAEVQYRPTTYAKVLAGIRHESHSAFGHEDLPRVGLVLNPFEKTALKVNHGKHFNAPTPNDLYWPDDGFVAGNPDLQPETGWHTDATVEQSLMDDNLFLTMSYFHWDLDDKIIWEPNSNGKFIPQNMRSYTADGVELGAKVGPIADLALSLSYTYTDAEEENRAYTKQDYGWPPFFPPDFQYTWVKRRASYSPRHQFKGNLTWWSHFGLTGTATARYVSDRIWYRTESTGYPNVTTVEYTLPSYWTADIKLEQKLLDHWKVSVQGTNLFDKGYDVYLSPFSNDQTGAKPTAGYPGAGRAFFCNVTYEY